jgi:hypothetical protein
LILPPNGVIQITLTAGERGYSGATSVRASGFANRVSQIKDVLAQSDEPLAVRMVIQQVGLEQPTYNVVVYGDLDRPRHAEFLNAKSLSETLQVVVPDLDISGLSLNPMQDGFGSIVFAGEVTLSSAQISALGLM